MSTSSPSPFDMPEPHGVPPPPPPPTPPQFPPSPSSSPEPTRSSDMSNVYLMTFVITLIILLSISAAIIGRSMLLRRRFRQRVNEAIRAGVLTADGRFPDPPGQGANREKPKMWDVWLDQRWDYHSNDEPNDGEKPKNGRFEWKDLMPVSATIIRQSIAPSTSDPHFSAIQRARELFGPEPVQAEESSSSVGHHFANVGLITTTPRDRSSRPENPTNSNNSRNSSIFFREPSLLYSRQRRARAQSEALHTATRAALAARLQQASTPDVVPPPSPVPSRKAVIDAGTENIKQTLAVSVLIAMPCSSRPQYIRPSPPPLPPLSSSPDSPASTLVSCSPASSGTKLGSPESLPSKALQKSPFRFSSALSPHGEGDDDDNTNHGDVELPEVMLGTAEMEWLAEYTAAAIGSSSSKPEPLPVSENEKAGEVGDSPSSSPPALPAHTPAPPAPVYTSVGTVLPAALVV